MTVLRIDRLEQFWAKHSEAERPLLAWLAATQRADWKKPTELLQTFSSADVAVKVASGRRVVIFDIGGNKYRLVAAVDYRAQLVNILHVLTHAEYDKEKWKKIL